MLVNRDSIPRTFGCYGMPLTAVCSVSDVHISVGRKESLSDHGPFTLIQQQHLPRLKVRANWHVACASPVHLGSLALPYRCEGVHVGSSVPVCACPCSTTFGWGSCGAPPCKKSASVSSVLSARSKRSCWHRRSDASKLAGCHSCRRPRRKFSFGRRCAASFGCSLSGGRRVIETGHQRGGWRTNLWLLCAHWSLTSSHCTGALLKDDREMTLDLYRIASIK